MSMTRPEQSGELRLVKRWTMTNGDIPALVAGGVSVVHQIWCGPRVGFPIVWHRICRECRPSTLASGVRKVR